MSKVYFLENDEELREMTRVRCKNEEKELQLLLYRNHQLLPGDQIRPDDPRRWLLIKREMPVEDPASAEQRWNIDFFFTDQDGIPTFVECKRFNDTRSRREVVGQMLEYAANGHYYWTKDKFREYAAEEGIDLDEAVRTLEPESGESVEDFLELIENNLREGQLRLIFFLEEAPFQLKSIVDFLNRQMERSEVLIVEAKQYQKDDLRLVIPSLFGYTEEARRIKRSVTVASSMRRKWDEPQFFEQASQQLAGSEIAVLNRIYRSFVENQECEIRWGTGNYTGSFNVVVPKIMSNSIFTVRSDGKMYLNFGWLEGSEQLNRFRDELRRDLANELGITLEPSARWPGLQPGEWMSKVDRLITTFEKLVSAYS